MSDRERKLLLYEQFARMGKALANPLRLELIDVLAQGERSVDDLATSCGWKLSNTSAQLKVLQHAGLLRTRRDGVKIFYRVADTSVLEFVESLKAMATETLPDAEKAARDYLGDVSALQPVGRGDLADLIARGEVVVVDVRPAEEYAAGHIAGALSIPHDQLAARLAELPKESLIVAYCRGRFCVMAPEAVRLLRANGFDARLLADGWPQWHAEGLPVAS